MEIARAEVEAVQKVVQVSEEDVCALADLQLALLGGGIGEVIFA